jgi:hypothetical protein
MDEKPITLETGKSIVLQLLVIGQRSGEAVISSPDLPAFATLDGSRLTLAPARSFVGDYAITLVAKSGSDTTSATLHVAVRRENTPPSARFWGWADSNGAQSMYCRPTGPLQGTPSIFAWVRDEEGDTVTWEVEVVKKGEPFTGKATYSLTGPVGVDHSDPSHCSGATPGLESCFELPFDGLGDGETYSFAMRMRDQFGAVTSFQYAGGGPEIGDGWWTAYCWEFTTAP